MHSDQQALLRGILENPADNSRREVFADWLEENGQLAFAETIRVGLELHRTDKNDWDKNDIVPRLESCIQKETDRIRFANPAKLESRIPDISYRPGEPWLKWNQQDTPATFLDRGFLSRISCSKDFFFNFALDLFQKHPIEKVYLSDVFFSDVHGTEDTGFVVYKACIHQDIPRELIHALESGWVVICPSKKNTSETANIMGRSYGDVFNQLSDYLVEAIREELDLPKLSR